MSKEYYLKTIFTTLTLNLAILLSTDVWDTRAAKMYQTMVYNLNLILDHIHRTYGRPKLKCNSKISARYDGTEFLLRLCNLHLYNQCNCMKLGNRIFVHRKSNKQNIIRVCIHCALYRPYFRQS